MRKNETKPYVLPSQINAQLQRKNEEENIGEKKRAEAWKQSDHSDTERMWPQHHNSQQHTEFFSCAILAGS